MLMLLRRRGHALQGREEASREKTFMTKIDSCSVVNLSVSWYKKKKDLNTFGQILPDGRKTSDVTAPVEYFSLTMLMPILVAFSSSSSFWPKGKCSRSNYLPYVA